MFWKSKYPFFYCVFSIHFVQFKKKEIGYYPHREQKIVDFFLTIREKEITGKILVFIRLQSNCWIKSISTYLSVVCKWLNYGNYDIKHKSTESCFFCILEREEKKNRDLKPYSRETKWITLQRVCITAQNDERRSKKTQ